MINIHVIVDLANEIGTEVLQNIVSKKATHLELVSFKNSKVMYIFIYAALLQENLHSVWKRAYQIQGYKEIVPEEIYEITLEVLQHIETYVKNIITGAIPKEIGQKYLDAWEKSDCYSNMINNCIDYVEKHKDIINIDL